MFYYFFFFFKSYITILYLYIFYNSDLKLPPLYFFYFHFQEYDKNCDCNGKFLYNLNQLHNKNNKIKYQLIN